MIESCDSSTTTAMSRQSLDASSLPIYHVYSTLNAILNLTPCTAAYWRRETFARTRAAQIAVVYAPRTAGEPFSGTTRFILVENLRG